MDFQDGTYRIKPIEDNAFKIGDVLVEKAEEGKANPKLYKCTDIGRNQVYYFEDGSVLAKELVNSKFINIADVLWFFTGVTTEDTYKLLNTTMETIREAQEYYKGSVRDITPMYSMGFRLPNEELDPMFYDDDVIVHRDLIGEPLSERNLLTISYLNIATKQYIFIDGSAKSISEVDEEYIEAFSENTLWYFEFKLKDVGWITPADNKRMTFTEASFTSLISLNYDDMETKAVLDRRILFSLGFQLKE